VDTRTAPGRSLAGSGAAAFISNQSKYNVLYRAIEPEVVPTCRDLGIGQICFSPIEQGLLTGKYRPGVPVPRESRATDAHGAQFITGLLTDELLTRVQQLAPLAAAEGMTMSQMALAWVLQNDNAASAITGGSRPEQVTDNAAAAGKTLSSETLAGIDIALGDAVERDGSLVGSMSPKNRPT
jgi:aryl-alcohol dehydrogenase-like predicted oxidoreductase